MARNTLSHAKRPAIISALTATGTTQATALALADNTWHEFTTVASGTGAVLPQNESPSQVSIFNAGVNTILIYPQPGGTINNGTVNAPFSVFAGGAYNFSAISATNWYSFGAASISGSGTPTGASGSFQYNNAGGFGGATNFGYDATNTCPIWTPQADPASPLAGDRWLSTASNGPVDCRVVDGSSNRFLVRADGTFFSCGPCTNLISFTTAASLLQSPTSPMGSLVIPANTLKVGDLIELWFSGVYSSTGTSFLVLSVFAGATQLCTSSGSSQPAAETALPWGTMAGPFMLLVTAVGASGAIFTGGTVCFTKGGGATTNYTLSNGAASGSSGTPIAVDTTAAITLDLRCACQVSSASNAISIAGCQARIRG
jgi:hypothetical protein